MRLETKGITLGCWILVMFSNTKLHAHTGFGISQRTYALGWRQCTWALSASPHALLPLTQSFIFKLARNNQSPHLRRLGRDEREEEKSGNTRKRLIIPTGLHLSCSLKPVSGTSVPDVAALAKLPAVF